MKKKHPWPWTEAFSSAIFNAAAAELVTLANATPDKIKTLPSVLANWQTQARRIAATLATAERVNRNLPAVPLPVTFSLVDGRIDWSMNFPTVAELTVREGRRQNAESDAWNDAREDTLVPPDHNLGITESATRLFGAFTLVVALSVDDRLRFRLKQCATCEKFKLDKSVRAGDRRKGGRRTFCSKACERKWMASPTSRADARERQRRRREAQALRAR